MARPGLLIALWLLMLVSAIANGTIGEYAFKPRFGEYGSHVYKTLAAIAVTLACSWYYAVKTRGPGSQAAAWTAGVLWLGLTVGFEFVFGHFVMGHPWERLLADYRIWEGRLWPLLLAALLFGPAVMGRAVKG